MIRMRIRNQTKPGPTGIPPSAQLAKTSTMNLPCDFKPMNSSARIKRGLGVVALLAALGASSAHAAFSITLDYSDSPQAPSQKVLDAAASAKAFWESAITGYQETAHTGVTYGGTTVNFNLVVDTIDGVGLTVAVTDQSFNVMFSDNFLYTEGGRTLLDMDDAANLSLNQLSDVIIHEFAHVLGFGVNSMWDPAGQFGQFGYQQLFDSDINSPTYNQYIGASALAEFQSEFSQPGATHVPLEQTLVGSRWNHWDEPDDSSTYTGLVDQYGRDLGEELMSSIYNGNPWVSRTTVAQFEDLGYTVDFAAVAIPEANPLALVAAGLALVGAFRRRR